MALQGLVKRNFFILLLCCATAIALKMPQLRLVEHKCASEGFYALVSFTCPGGSLASSGV